ncbi:UNVERIFIED_CONTAM: hypothetical protein K2H54_030554 [Gekko kuhli]
MSLAAKTPPGFDNSKRKKTAISVMPPPPNNLSNIPPQCGIYSQVSLYILANSHMTPTLTTIRSEKIWFKDYKPPAPPLVIFRLFTVVLRATSRRWGNTHY